MNQKNQESMLQINHFSFSYPACLHKTLSDIDLTLENGEFVVLCGPSGCGKTTLLRMLKPSIALHGTAEGEIFFEGKQLKELNDRQQTEKIGFVQQNPENQIVTDKVWHELAFAMESLGYETPYIRKKCAEMAEFFGIESWFYKNVNELSGGQKQLLNLAGVMTLDPELLVLDEPTSQLDPVAAGEFLSVLGKINRELGTTVLLTEHRLEEALPLADRMLMMENGRIICNAKPEEAGRSLFNANSSMFAAMPAAMRIWAGLSEKKEEGSPVTVKDGRDFLSCRAETAVLQDLSPEILPVPAQETVLQAEGVYFRYEKEGPDIVKELSLTVNRGEFITLLGGNGTGKTTAFKVLAGLYEPQHGTIRRLVKTVLLPQDPKTLFVKPTVRKELEEMNAGPEETEQLLRLFQLEAFQEQNPFDLSGGEQQRLGLAKVLLAKPELLLLDEPTKGMDAAFKKKLALLIYDLLKKGMTIMMVSHDVEFCASYAGRCLMFFDGNVIAEGTPRNFFSGNSFYTTAASRMSRGLLKDAVTVEDVLEAYGKPKQKQAWKALVSSSFKEESLGKERAAERTMPAAELTETETLKKTASGECSGTDVKQKMSPARKVLAILAGMGAVITMLHIISQTKLSELIAADGLTDLTMKNYPWYIALAVSFVLLIHALGNRGFPVAGEPGKAGGVTGKSTKLSVRTKASLMLILALIPATLFAGWLFFGGRQYYLIALLVLLECFIPFILVFEGRKPQPRELVLIAVMAAIGIAGRTVFFALPSFTPVIAIVVIAGVAFGAESGFMTGAVTMLVSNFMFGQGPWTPWQMFAMGLIGYLAGICFNKGLLQRNRESLAVFGAAAAVLIYGGIMNPASGLMWDWTGEAKTLPLYYIAGLPVDLVHATSSFVFLWFFGEPLLAKLGRVKEKYGICTV